MVQYFLERDLINDFVAHLMSRKTVYAPHRTGRRSFTFALAENAAEVVLDYPRTMQSVRKLFLPPREKLLHFDLKENVAEPAKAEPVDAIFLGVHSYDLAALHRLDYNFGQGNPERNYLTRRQGALFVGVSFEPDKHHFCGSLGIHPGDVEGFDLFLTKLLDGYVLEAVTPAGDELLQGFDLPAHEAGKPAPRPFQQHIYVPQNRLGEVMSRSYDNPVWSETAEKCVGCGTCNLVCPTCYCFNVEDNVDITVTHGSRERCWDGCMLRNFTEVAGGEVFRDSLAARQRHRVFRKFKYISDETGQPWCVGCGRCNAGCTADISIVNIVNRLVGDSERVTESV